RISPRRWKKAQAWSSAIESAPPDTATISPGTAESGAPPAAFPPFTAFAPPAAPAGGSGAAARQSLKALRTAALAGSRYGRRLGGVWSSMDAIEPALGFVAPCGARLDGRFGEDAGEALLTDRAAVGTCELRT